MRENSCLLNNHYLYYYMQFLVLSNVRSKRNEIKGLREFLFEKYKRYWLYIIARFEMKKDKNKNLNCTMENARKEGKFIFIVDGISVNLNFEKRNKKRTK